MVGECNLIHFSTSFSLDEFCYLCIAVISSLFNFCFSFHNIFLFQLLVPHSSCRQQGVATSTKRRLKNAKYSHNLVSILKDKFV